MKKNSILAAAILCCAMEASAQTATDVDTVPEELLEQIDETLGLEPMDCDPDSPGLSCIVDYLQGISKEFPAYIDGRVEAIREAVDKGENAAERYDEAISVADALIVAAAEGGPLSTEMDRVGVLLQELRDSVLDNPDLVAAIDERIQRLQNVRDNLGIIRTGAADVRDVLGASRTEAIVLLQLEEFDKAITMMEETVESMGETLASLVALADRGVQEPDPDAVGD